MITLIQLKPVSLNVIWVLFLVVLPYNGFSQNGSTLRNGKVTAFLLKQKHGEVKSENKKITAITLGVTLGIFGVHRLYLGTAEHIPLVYGVTLGGGGIITLIDIVAIAVTKDFDKYQNNPKVFMWSGSSEDSAP